MFPDIEDAEINSRLVGYCSDQVTNHSTAAGHVTTELTSDWLLLGPGPLQRREGGAHRPRQAALHRERREPLPARRQAARGHQAGPRQRPHTFLREY